jgi:hypothetical protein
MPLKSELDNIVILTMGNQLLITGYVKYCFDCI